jgi:hypothetical protein
MPNDLRRSFSALFSRGGKDRSSGRKDRDDLPSRKNGKQEKPTLIKTIPNRPPIAFNDDYVDPLDIVPKEIRIDGTYDEPWDCSARLSHVPPPPNIAPNQSYDIPWDSSLAETPRQPGAMTYDEPWDRAGTMSGNSGTISTLSSHSSSNSHSSHNNSRQLYRPPIIDNFKDG